MKMCCKLWNIKIPVRNNPNNPTGKLIGPHNEGRLPSNNYKQGRIEDERTRGRLIIVLCDSICDEGWLELVEGVS